eukprot:4684943-Alexandrium_andersonii.AAC.1
MPEGERQRGSAHSSNARLNYCFEFGRIGPGGRLPSLAPFPLTCLKWLLRCALDATVGESAAYSHI